MKIAMVAPTAEGDEIAEYARALGTALGRIPDTEIEFVSIHIGRRSDEHYIEQAARLNADDVSMVHIQHRHEFWGSLRPGKRLPLATDSAYWRLRYLIKKPVVITAHETDPAELLLSREMIQSRFGRRLLPILTRNLGYCQSIDIAPFTTAWTIVHTAAERNALIARGARSEFVSIVPCGVDQSVTETVSVEEVSKRLGVQDRLLVTQFGNCTQERGCEIDPALIECLPEGSIVAVAMRGARAIPSGSLAARLAPFLSQSDTDSTGSRTVFCRGLTGSETIDLVAASNIVVLCEVGANVYTLLSSALAFGRVIIAPDVAPFREMSARLDCVELFAQDDRVEYHRILRSLVANRERSEKLGANALRYADRFRWPKVAELTRRVYQSAFEVYSQGHHPH